MMQIKKLTNLLKRLDLCKDADPYNRMLLNDCFDVLMDCAVEIAKVRVENNILNEVIKSVDRALENSANEDDNRV